MYEDSWYSFPSEINTHVRKASTNSVQGHKRKESLLQQPNGVNAVEIKVLDDVYEEQVAADSPPEPTLARRAASYADLYDLVKENVASGAKQKRKRVKRRTNRLDALLIHVVDDVVPQSESDDSDSSDELDDQILEGSQQEYSLYRDQLALTERHLDSLISDANDTLKLLSSLSVSFQSVEQQTSSFQAQCEDLIGDQKRLEKLSEEVGTDLHYYAYLETATRRLNAPSASRLVDDDDFSDIVNSLDACVAFMEKHENYRDRDQYLARYSSWLTKALHLLDHGLATRLGKILPEISRQVAATKSESARHALAYGRFEEAILNSYALILNIQRVVRRAYDQFGRGLQSNSDLSAYTTASSNMFNTYVTARDSHLKILVQHDLQEFQKEVKELSVETACRNLVKQLYERMYSEDGLFRKIFGIDPLWNKATNSAFHELKNISTTITHPGNLAPLAANLQSTLQSADLDTVCNIVGWLANEYAVTDPDEEDTPFTYKCREYTARLLVEHLWVFTDAAFEAEITKSISKAPVQDASLKMGPVEKGVAASNAYPLTKRAIELLVMFDRAMPKERSSKNSAVVFKIVRETIQVLQRAEARLKSLKTSTDPDLFMVKNLLIMKNELVSLEIGDITSAANQSMQHFSLIWDTLTPSNWVSFFSNILSGSLWSRGPPSVTAKMLTVEDMNEQLDELLRQSIYAFTRRWGGLVNDSESRKAGTKPIAKLERELEALLSTAFGSQPEVVGKLKEAIAMNAKAQSEAKDQKAGGR